YYRTFDGDSNWSQAMTIPGALTHHAPSVTLFGNGIVCAHQGIISNNGQLVGDGRLWLNWTTANGNWYGETPLGSTVGISQGPSVLAAGGSLYCFYQGSPAKGTGNQLQYNYMPTSGWVGEQQVPDVWLTNGPGACVFNKRIFCFHQGHDNELWCQ